MKQENGELGESIHRAKRLAVVAGVAEFTRNVRFLVGNRQGGLCLIVGDPAVGGGANWALIRVCER